MSHPIPPDERDMTAHPSSPCCYREHLALCEVAHSLHGRVVTLEQRVAMLERLVRETRNVPNG